MTKSSRQAATPEEFMKRDRGRIIFDPQMFSARKRRIEGLNLLETHSDDFYHENERDKSVPQEPTFVSRVAVAIWVQGARFFEGCFYVSRDVA